MLDYPCHADVHLLTHVENDTAAFCRKLLVKGGNGLGVGALELSETITQMAGRGLECIAVLRAGTQLVHNCTRVEPQRFYRQSLNVRGFKDSEP